MTVRKREDSADPIFDAPEVEPGGTCRLVGNLRVQDDGQLRLYPTADEGVWLEIDPRDILERIDAPDPGAPSAIVVFERSMMSLRMDVTASAARSLLSAAGADSAMRLWPDWRAAPRGRSPAGSSRRATMMRKASARFS